MKSMELFEANKCFTVSLVDNKDQHYSSLFHATHDYCHQNLVNVLKSILEQNDCMSFKDIYIDYVWMGNTKGRFKKSLFEDVIPGFGSSTVLQQGGTICIPICMITIQWITFF
jgi:hypothetical protein